MRCFIRAFPFPFSLCVRACLVLILPLLGAGCATSGTTAASSQVSRGEGSHAAIPENHVRFLCQPNGWGSTPEAAIRDLRQRILPWYQKNYGHRPGFEIDWDWYALVEVTDGRLWQADGRLWWYAPPVIQSRSRSRSR